LTDSDDGGPALPEPLDAGTDHEWRNLAAQVMRARNDRYCARTNISLLAAADREPEAPPAPFFRLWMADNLAFDGNYAEAARSYDDCLEACGAARRLTAHQDPAAGALLHKAEVLELSGDAPAAIAAYRDLIERQPAGKSAALEAGRIAERVGDDRTAYEFYGSVASTELTPKTDDPAQLARRARDRLADGDTRYSTSATELADQLIAALDRREAADLQRLASRTHFAVGPIGGHTGFESADMLDAFLRELSLGEVRAKRQLLGSGGKRYVPTTGWKGRWFQGEVTLILSEAPKGWQWTGIALHTPNEHWVERWKPAIIQTNGLFEHIAEAAIVAAAWPFSGVVAVGFASANCCGWGARGFYYNIGPTHDEEDAFAIDFTRYRRFVPYDNESGGTPVLAVHEGVVSCVRAGKASGDSSTDNRVQIEHADPANPADASRYTSKYLHLEGPFRVPVSQGMPVRVGTRLGFMDDTGNSILDHLHFSIHDRQLPYSGAPEGKSVRPSPMSGRTLGDSDSNKCIESNNVDYTGENIVLHPSSFAGQNWLITPAALAVNEAQPSSIVDQKWLLVLSGVVNIDLKGNSSQWLRETFRIMPDVFAPMNHAVGRYNIPTPRNSGFTLRFQVEQWVPHSAPSSMFNKNHAINSGFAVDLWRPHPFGTDTDVLTNAGFGNVFSGIQVDVAVSDTDAFLYRLSYHIVLLGKIRFGQPIIIE
jgi:tetratricopeptide (TPR) repeat protein